MLYMYWYMYIIKSLIICLSNWINTEPIAIPLNMQLNQNIITNCFIIFNMKTLPFTVRFVSLFCKLSKIIHEIYKVAYWPLIEQYLVRHCFCTYTTCTR